MRPDKSSPFDVSLPCAFLFFFLFYEKKKKKCLCAAKIDLVSEVGLMPET